MTVRCSGHCVNGLMTAQRRNEGGGDDNGRGVDDDVDKLHVEGGGVRLPNGPGRLASFRAPNDGPVRGMHFGGLVRPVTESEYLGPDIDDCSFRIRF